jgi:hypothetical protein
MRKTVMLIVVAVVLSLSSNQANACQMVGPYATMRRANEVANVVRSYGYSACPLPPTLRRLQQQTL